MGEDGFIIEAEMAPAIGNDPGKAVPFSVHVIETALGPIALPPTELAAYDVDHELRDYYMDLHRSAYKRKVMSRTSSWLRHLADKVFTILTMFHDDTLMNHVAYNSSRQHTSIFKLFAWLGPITGLHVLDSKPFGAHHAHKQRYILEWQ